LKLEPATRKRLLELVLENSSLPVIANVSDLRPEVALDLARFARQNGAAAVAIMAPHFYPVAQPDLVEFFVRVGEAAQLPVLLYNFPERTGNRIDLPTIAEVADRIPLAAIKQSGAEFDYHRALVQLGREKDFVVFTGADTRLPEALSLGATGCVSGLANVVPELVVEIFDAARARPSGPATAAGTRMQELARRIGALAFPLDVAASMEARGLVVGTPKSLLSPGTQRIYAQLVIELKALFREWKLV
jgi:4-hydroxy-tetrahydrodipicolinate synthase